MTENISRKEFYKANEKTVSLIKDYLDEKFQAHEDTDAVRHANTEKTLNEHDKTLHGDATAPGLRIKVDRLNTWSKTAAASVGIAFSAIVTYLKFK